MKISERSVNPLAELFPMMSEEAIADLAEDIKANGLQHPIVVDKDGAILDGRNRAKACALAGVEPTIAQANGTDPLSLVISLNVKRRNMKAQQLACAAAEAWKLAEKEEGKIQTKGGDRKSTGKSSPLIREPEEYFAVLFGSNEKYVKQARALLRDDRVAFNAVKNAGADLGESFKAMQERKKAAASDDARLVELRAQAPDLADLVADEKLKLSEAYASFDQRRKDDAEREANLRETLLRLSESAYRGITAWANDGFAGSVKNRISEKEFAKGMKDRLMFDKNGIDSLILGAKHLASILKEMCNE